MQISIATPPSPRQYDGVDDRKRMLEEGLQCESGGQYKHATKVFLSLADGELASGDHSNVTALIALFNMASKFDRGSDAYNDMICVCNSRRGSPAAWLLDREMRCGGRKPGDCIFKYTAVAMQYFRDADRYNASFKNLKS